jgi:hypothetical protein
MEDGGWNFVSIFYLPSIFQLNLRITGQRSLQRTIPPVPALTDEIVLLSPQGARSG